MESNRRKTFRCALPGDPAQAVLTVGKTQHPAAVIDESREGFGIVVDDDPAVQEGQTARLQTPSGCSEVKVAEILRDGDRFRLGLVRLSEIPINDYKQSLLACLFSSGHRSTMGQARPSYLPNFGLGFVLAVSVAVALFAWWFVFGGPGTR